MIGQNPAGSPPAATYHSSPFNKAIGDPTNAFQADNLKGPSMNKLIVRAVFLFAALLLRYPAPAAADTFEVLNISSIGAIDANSFSLSGTGTELTLHRDVDLLTPKIFLAVSDGTIFPSATLEFFDTSISSTVPTLTFELKDAIFVSAAISGAGELPTETDVLDAESITRQTAPTPEPATLTLVGAGVLVALRRKLKAV
jgi:Type VI secretion system effector, Hcp/PEP-CTERM motif